MSASEWTVVRVMDNPSSWVMPDGPAKGKTFVTYWMAIEDGHEEKFVYTNRMPETAAPQAGDSVYGTVTQNGTTKSGKPKLKFKAEQRPDFNKVSAPQQPANAGGVANGGNQMAPSFDARGARIERMAAHKSAAVLTGTNPSHDQQEATFKRWLAWLSEDLDAYERVRGAVAAGNGGAIADAAQRPVSNPGESPGSAPEISEQEAAAHLTGYDKGEQIADDQSVPF